MIGEEKLIKVLDRTPLFMIKLSGERASLVERTLVTSVVLVFVYINVARSASVPVQDIYSFVVSLYYPLLIASACCSLWLLWFKVRQQHVTLADFRAVDQSLNLNLTTSPDYFLGAWVGYHLVYFGYNLSQTIYYYSPFPFEVFFGVLFWHITQQVYSQVLLLKYMVTKRVRFVVEENSEENWLEQVGTVRTLLDMNSNINEFYSLTTGMCVVVDCFTIIHYTANLWLYFGLHFDVTYFDAHVFARIILIQLNNLRVLGVAKASSKVSDLISSLQWEIDRSISTELWPLSYRKQLLVFLQELHHSPRDFTAMDLFSVDCSMVTALCGLVLNYLMVFVQFMKA